MDEIAENGSGRRAMSERDGVPAVFHVTHWKAGSTWLTRILRRCARQRIVTPRQGVGHFLDDPIEPGGVYPRVYVTEEEFNSITLPEHWRRFIVIRDLRDTLVSAYFSVKLSHPENPVVVEDRARLRAMRRKDGLAWILGQPMITKSAEIQSSWVAASVPVIRYEDLLEADIRILQRVLIDECEFPLSRPELRRIVKRTRFQRLSGGRKRGDEDVTSHFRKADPGDWRNYFNDSLTKEFKDRWGDLLIATGYEQDNDW